MVASPSNTAVRAILPELGFIIPGPIHFWAAPCVNYAGLSQDPKPGGCSLVEVSSSLHSAETSGKSLVTRTLKNNSPNGSLLPENIFITEFHTT